MKNFTINCHERETKACFARSLEEILKGELPVIVCIGTDAVAGDSLGPLVGSMLKQKLLGKTYVFGTIDCPITAKDVFAISEFTKNVYPNCPILAIDAALGEKEEIGKVKILNKPIKPGLGVNKNLNEIGTTSIIGVVEEKGKGKNLLSSVRLSLVYSMAEKISNGIEEYIVKSSEQKRLEKSFKIC